MITIFLPNLQQNTGQHINSLPNPQDILLYIKEYKAYFFIVGFFYICEYLSRVTDYAKSSQISFFTFYFLSLQFF